MRATPHAGWEAALSSLVAGFALAGALGAVSHGAKAGSWAAEARRGAGSVNALSFAAFFMGCAELLARRRASRPDEECLWRRLLPEDEKAIIDSTAIPKILAGLRGLPAELRESRLARLVETCAIKYQTSTSVGEVASTLQSQADSEYNRLDSGLSLVRYLLWVIPSLGFIGTVIGLSGALISFEAIGTDRNVVAEITLQLAYAFDTTFVALVLACVLMFAYHRMTEAEEGLLNSLSDYCMRNFVVRAYYPEEHRSARGR